MLSLVSTYRRASRHCRVRLGHTRTVSAHDGDPRMGLEVVWSRASDVVWRAAPQYLALAKLDGSAIEVQGPGSDIWDLLSSPSGQEELIEAVAQRYSTRPDVIADDVGRLLAQLIELGYVDRDS